MYASLHIYSDYISYYRKYESGLGNVKKQTQKHNKKIWSNLKQVGWGLQECVCVDSIIKC